jgi:hypothetical protein
MPREPATSPAAPHLSEVRQRGSAHTRTRHRSARPNDAAFQQRTARGGRAALPTRLRTRARRAGQRWMVGGARWAWQQRPRRPAGAVIQRAGSARAWLASPEHSAPACPGWDDCPRHARLAARMPGSPRTGRYGPSASGGLTSEPRCHLSPVTCLAEPLHAGLAGGPVRRVSADGGVRAKSPEYGCNPGQRLMCR